MAKKKNPVIERAREEGRKEGIRIAVDFFANKFEKLDQVPGIGPATIKKLRKVLGEQYFEKR